jgi:hypothetical protein
LVDVAEAGQYPTILVDGVPFVYWPALGTYWPDPIFLYETWTDWLDELFD